MHKNQPSNDLRKRRIGKAAIVPLVTVFVGVAGIALRLHGVFERSLWHDEAFSWRLTQFPLDEMLRRVALDVHPPLHFLLLKGWIGLFGDSVVAMRGLSVLLGMATILGMYLFCVEAFGGGSARVERSKGRALELAHGPSVEASKGRSGETAGTSAIQSARWIGCLTAALTAVSVFHIRYSWEVRMYTQGTALLAFSSWMLFRAIHRGRIRDWVLYSVITLALAYTHYYCLFSIAAQFIFLLGWLLVRNRGNLLALIRDRAFQSATASALVIGAGFMPWTPALLAQRAQVQENYWTREVRARDVTFVCYQMFVEPEDARFDKTYAAVAAILTAAFVLALLARTRRADWYVFLAAVTPFALSILVSKFDTKIFHLRYFLFAHLLILAAIARLVCRIPAVFPRAAVAGWLVANSLLVTVWFYDTMDFATRPGPRAAAEFVDKHRQLREPVIVCSGLYYLSLIYHAGDRNGWYCYDEGGDGVIHYEGSAALVDGEQITDSDIEKLEARRVWVVDMTGGGWGERSVPVPRGWRLVQTVSYREAYGVQGTMLVREYERADGGGPVPK